MYRKRSLFKQIFLRIIVTGMVFFVSQMTAFSQVESRGESLDFLFFGEPTFVFTAALKEQKVKDAASPIYVVTSRDIKLKGYSTLKDILNDIPGFEDLSDSNENIIGVRGAFASTTNKVLILINGHRMNSFELGRYNTDQFIGIDSVEQIEFIRGPGSALYGTGALIAVINIITRKGDSIEGNSVKFKGGSFNTEATFTFGRNIADELDVFFNFSYIDARGDEVKQPASVNVVPPGTVQEPGQVYWNKYIDNWSALTSIRYENYTFHIRKGHYSRATPRCPNGSLYVFDEEDWPPAYNQDDFYVDLSAVYEIGDNGKLIINPGYHYIELKEYSWLLSYGSNYLPPSGSRSGQFTEEVSYSLKIHYEIQVNEIINLILGYDGTLVDFQRSDGLKISDGTNITLTSQRMILDEWNINGLFGQIIVTPSELINFTAGIRMDDFDGEADTVLTPRLGIILNPSETLAFKILYGQSYLAPSWSHKKTTPGFAFQSNPDLDPEDFQSVDFIVEFKTEKLNAWINVFWNHIDGIITPDNTKGYQTYINYGESQYIGFETYSEFMINEKVKLNASYSYVENYDSDSQFLLDGKIKNIPEYILRYGIQILPVNNLILTLWGRTYSDVKTNDSVTGNTDLKGWTTFDFTLNYQFSNWDFQFQTINITDLEYEVAGTVTRPLARYGRGFHFSVGKKF